MFDLFRSRTKTTRIVLGAILVFVGFTMVVTLIPWGGGYGGFGGDSTVVASIGDEDLTQYEVDRQIRSAMRNRNFPRELANIFVPQMIDQMITERAMAFEAERIGFRVTSDDVNQTIASMLPQLYQGPKEVRDRAYAEFLSQQGLSHQQFLSNVRKQMLLTRLRSMVAEGVVVAPDEVEKEFRRRNEKIKLEYIAVTPDKLRSQVAVTPQEVEAFFTKNRAEYTIAAKHSFEMIVVDEAKVGERVQAPEAELRAGYERNKEQYRTPERVQVRHILLKTTEKPADEIPKIKARTEDLLKQIRSGADFAELAKKNSEDPGSAAKGGDLGWVVRGQTVKAFEETAFSLKPKEISNVVTTEYGFHILQVMAKEPARLKPFEEVREQLAKDVKRQRVFETMQSLADKSRAELIRSPQQATQIAQGLGVQYVKVDKAGAGDPIPEVGVNQVLESALNGLSKGRVTPVLQASGNKLFVAVLTDQFPSRPAELAEVESQVRERMINEKAGQLVDQRARELLDKAKASGGDLKKTAQGTGFEVKTTQEFGPEGAADGIGTAGQVAEGFGKDVGGLFGPVVVGGQRFICKVVAKTAADLTKLAEQRESILQELKSRKARTRDELFADSLRSRLIREGKVKINDDAIKRLMASYRG